MLLVLVLPFLLAGTVFVMATALLLKLAAMTGSEAAVWVMGGLAIGGLIYSAVSVHAECAAGPVFHPPACPDKDACGLGRWEHSCDGLSGAMTYLYSAVAVPITALLCSVVTFRIALRVRRERQEA